MKAWWESLQEREQKLVGIGGTALLVAVFYWGLWSPLGESMEKNQKLLTKQLSTNVWAKDALAQVKGASGADNTGGGSLQQIVNRTSRQYNIQIGRMNPKDELLNLLVEEIVFNDLLKWLAFLEQNHGIKVMKLDVTELDVPGKVRVSRLEIGKS